MNWKLLWVEVFAVMASYLVITTSVASAVTVRTYDSSEVEYGNPISNFNPGGLVEKGISVDPGTEVLSFVLSNGTSSVSLEGAWLYKCRDRNPYECMESVLVGVDAFSGDVDTSYGWGDVSGGDTANLLCFVKLDNGGNLVWVAFWTVVERDGQAFTVQESDISEIGVYARDIGLLPTIRVFIKSRFMIPANPDWISKVVFQGASSLYEISVDGEGDIDSQPNGAGYQEIEGSEVSSVSRDYSFLLPVASPQVSNPVTLHLNPSYTCGMFGCESDRGESKSNCCLDCGCSGGYYCDNHWGCRPVDGIGLSIYGIVNPRVEDCFESHTVSIPVKIDHAPTGHSVAESWCKLGGVFSPCVCEGLGDVYVCPVEVQPVPECGSGEFRVTNNAIRLRVEYMDGDTLRDKYVETAFPDVTIGSFECGQGRCESYLGESWENCCYDCPCHTGYCDYRTGDDPDSGVCREDPDSGDVNKIGKYRPDHLYTHNTGDQVSMNIVVSNKPETFRLDGVSCETGCVYDYTEECDSSCSISCTEEASSDSGEYNMTCTIAFTVSEYSPLRNYDLTPELTLDVIYRNGTLGDVYKRISRTLGYFSIGPHWCGDEYCGEEDEDSDNCCYDCPCPGNQYCDTQSIDGPTEGDGCREDFGIVIDSVGSLGLVDSTQEHEVPVLMHVENCPNATDMGDFVFECLLEEGDVDCSLDCDQVASGDPGDYNLSCRLIVPALGYVTSPYYDEGDRDIRLNGNSLNVSLYYNNGFNREVKDRGEALGEVVIEVTSHCGEGSGDPPVMCETWLGEDQTNCCRDCNCSDFGNYSFCYHGPGYPNGLCMNESEIGLAILGFEPDPWECLMGKIGGKCKYIKKHVVNAHIVNSPGDLEILDVFYRIDGGEPTTTDCMETATYGNWDCAFIPDSLEGFAEGNVSRTFNLSMSVNYTLNGVTTVKDISAFNETIETSRKKSSILESCETRIGYINDTINRLKSNQKDYDKWGMWYKFLGYLYIMIGITILAKCGWWSPSCSIYGYMMIAMGLIMLYLAGIGGDTSTGLNTQIEYFEGMKKQLEDHCSSPEFEDAALAAQGMPSIPSVIYPS